MTRTARRGLSLVSAADSVELSGETIGEALTRRAREVPDEPALVWLTETGNDSTSWIELYRRACRTASRLIDIDTGRGRVALVSFNSVEWIVAMYGCALVGMPVVPLSASITDAEAQYLLGHAKVSVVLCDSAVAEGSVLDRVRRVAGALESPATVCDIREFTSGTQDFNVSTAPVDPRDEFLLQYTSGTTGHPKAACLSHRAAFNSARIYGQSFGARHGDVHFNPLPLHHVGASLSGVVVALSAGCAYTVVERFSPQLALRVLRELRPALLGLVPTMLIDLLSQPQVSESDFASVRTVLGGATAVDPALIDDMERRLGVTFMVSYGQSEAPMMASSSPEDPGWVRTRTLGRCLPGRDYCVRDPSGQVVPTGSVGELCVAGPLITSGYLQADGTIDAALDQDGWLHTGDLCTMDDQAVLTFRGRIREVIVRGGENIYPAELEHALSAHESISEITIFGVDDARLGERVVAAVISAPNSRIEVTTLADFASAQLSRHKQPSEWIVASSFPRTSTGKVRKHLLRKWHEDGTIYGRCNDGDS